MKFTSKLVYASLIMVMTLVNIQMAKATDNNLDPNYNPPEKRVLGDDVTGPGYPGFGNEINRDSLIIAFEKACKDGADAVKLAGVNKYWRSVMSKCKHLYWESRYSISLFMSGTFYYKDPNQGVSKAIDFKDLADPLNATLDLSGCGKAKDYIRITTSVEEFDKKEESLRLAVLISPYDMIKTCHAARFSEALEKWDPIEVPIGLFFRKENEDNYKYDVTFELLDLAIWDLSRFYSSYNSDDDSDNSDEGWEKPIDEYNPFDKYHHEKKPKDYHQKPFCIDDSQWILVQNILSYCKFRFKRYT